MLLATVSAISAVDDDSTVIADVSADDTVSNSVDDAVFDNNNVIDKNIENKVVKKDATTHVVNQDNVDEIFGGEGYTLADSVSEGDTLDFQGTIDKNHSLVFNKPINVVSSTQDAVVSLHTVAGSLMGEDPGNSFVVNNGASGSNISSIYLENTECWIHNVHDAVLKNMTMHVKDARVGSGVGQTSVRYCDNVTLDSCHIYTENNGGSSSFVWTATSNSAIINSTVEGQGNVGNLFYIGNGFNTGDKPADFIIRNCNNTVRNCTIITPNGGGICIPMRNDANNTTVDGVIAYASGSVISSGANGTLINCVVYQGCGITMAANSVGYNNTVMGTGSMTIAANSTVYNNTLKAATINGANVLFENNSVSGLLTVSQVANVNNNNLSDVTINTNGKTSNITNNNVTGMITSKAVNVTIDSNNITTSKDNTVVVTAAGNIVTNNILLTSTKAGTDTLNVIDDTLVENNTPEAGAKFTLTDETYSDFFDAYGVLNNADVTNYSTLTFNGKFNDKSFIFDNIILSIDSADAVINNGFIETANNAVVAVEGFTFNNTKEAIPNSILLNTNGNLIRNNKFYRTSTSGVSREVMVNGDKNIITSNTFDLSVPVENIDYSEYPFAISNVSAVTTTGSFNTITSNNINVVNSTEGFGTISVIDLASRNQSSNNTVNSNIIVANSTGYLYGINLGANTDCNTINSNKITLNSGYYTAGIQIGYSPAYNNTINSNTLNQTSNIAYGILASAYGGEVVGSTINSNTIYITANQLAGIELCGSTPETIKDSTINSNKVIANGNYTIGIAISGSNINMITNNLTITGTTNATDTNSYDIIKPTTAGIVIQDSNNVNASNTTMEVVNGANVILKGTNNTRVISTLTTMTRFINTKNNANIILADSNNNVIEAQRAFTTGTYAVELTNSSNNIIKNNILNASNLKGGDGAILMDGASSDNTLENNTPNFGLLTDETYSTLFDENGLFTYPTGMDILTLAGDLHNKDLKFNNTIFFTNGGNYTIYNGTIIIDESNNGTYTDRYVNIRNININNTDKTAFIDNLTSKAMRNLQFYGGSIAVSGDDIVAIQSVKDEATYAIVDVENVTINMDGSNVKVVEMKRGVYSREDYVDIENCNITTTATGKNVAFEVVNTNLDILSNNIIQTGNEVVTMNASNVYANGKFFMNNNITVEATDANNLISLKDNKGSNANFGNNTITVTSENPACVINATNAGTVYVGQGQYSYASYNTPNTIRVIADNGEVPVVYLDGNGYVRNNFITASDVYGADSVSAKTVSNITPFTTQVEITTEDVLYKDGANTITAKAVGSDKKTATGTFVLTVNGKEVATAEGSTATFSYTPTSLDDVEIKVDFTNDTLTYSPSSNQKTVSVETNQAFITVEAVTASANQTVTLKATVKDILGNNINKGKVTFKVNGKTVKDANGKVIYAKVVDGQATAEYTVPENFNNNNYTITAVYAGSSGFSKVQNTSLLTLTKEEASIEFDNTPATAKVGQTVTLSVKVTGDAQKVVFKLNGRSLKDANGKIIYAKVVDGIASIEYTIPENTKAKDYTLSAVLLGSQRLTVNQTLTITE